MSTCKTWHMKWQLNQLHPWQASFVLCYSLFSTKLVCVLADPYPCPSTKYNIWHIINQETEYLGWWLVPICSERKNTTTWWVVWCWFRFERNAQTWRKWRIVSWLALYHGTNKPLHRDFTHLVLEAPSSMQSFSSNSTALLQPLTRSSGTCIVSIFHTWEKKQFFFQTMQMPAWCPVFLFSRPAGWFRTSGPSNRTPMKLFGLKQHQVTVFINPSISKVVKLSLASFKPPGPNVAQKLSAHKSAEVNATCNQTEVLLQFHWPALFAPEGLYYTS